MTKDENFNSSVTTSMFIKSNSSISSPPSTVYHEMSNQAPDTKTEDNVTGKTNIYGKLPIFQVIH